MLMQAAETEQKKRKRSKAPVSSSKPVKKGKSSKGLNLVDKWQAVRKDLVSWPTLRSADALTNKLAVLPPKHAALFHDVALLSLFCLPSNPCL